MSWLLPWAIQMNINWGCRYYHESKAGGGAVVEEGLPLLEQEVKNFSLIDPHSPSLEQDVKFDQNVFYIK